MIASSSYGLPFDYAETSAVSLDDVHAAARETVISAKLTWVVVGDLAKIEENVRALGIGDVEVWDAYGNKLR